MNEIKKNLLREEIVSEIPSDEIFRRWIGMIRWRLCQTEQVKLEEETNYGAYASSSELAVDVLVLLETVQQSSMGELADKSFRNYRELVEQPGFVEFFRRATPISEIEQFPIGSRPSRRKKGNSLANLRAIPWVFSWTQCRCLIPAWYGIGAAAKQMIQNDESTHLLQSMYREWSFFRATIDNAELALAKTDIDIAEQYANLASDSLVLTQIWKKISDEYQQTRKVILAITENKELLEGTHWLKESIRMCNRYIDPLNLVQVELLRRLRNCTNCCEEEIKELRHLSRLTINGLAAA